VDQPSGPARPGAVLRLPGGVPVTACAALYVRISSDPSGERAGVERQATECRALAERRGWTVVDTYEDDDRSAYSGKRRPAYERMLDDIRAGRIKAVLAWHPDRLYRRVRDLLDLISLAETHSIEIATVTAGDVDLSSPTGRAVATTICAWAGEFESSHKAERVAAAALARAKQGRIHGTRSFGYTTTTEIIEDEADAVRQGISMVIAGSSLRSVGRHFDSLGLTTVGGRRWSDSLGTLRQVLTSWKIGGVPSYKDQPLDGVDAQWPAIVSRETLDQVCAVLLDDRRRTNAHRMARKALLSGIATCAVCHGPMRSATKEVSRRNKNRVPVYRCHFGNHTTIRQQMLDELVIESVVAELLIADLTALAPTEADGVRMTELRDELDDIAKRRADISTLVAEGLLALPEARNSLTALSAAQEAAQGALRAISVRFGPAAFVARSRDLLTMPDAELDDEALAVTRRLGELDLGRQRSVVAALVEITVDRHEHANDRVVIRSRSSDTVVTPTPMSAKTLRFV